MFYDHIVKQRKHEHLESDSTLHVIGVISNPVRWNSRYRTFKRWLDAMEKQPNVVIYVVECAFGDRKFECTSPDNARHLQLRTKSEIWNKENLVNLGIKYLLPKDWKYVMWSDTDIVFDRQDIALKSIHELQNFSLIQPWSDALDLGPLGNVMHHWKSFGYLHQNRIKKKKTGRDPYAFAHTGYAWCATRAWYECTMGLIEHAILGSSDHHMAWLSVGDLKQSIHGKCHESYVRRCKEWMNRSCNITNFEVGYVPGYITHYFHGSKKKRYYRERWEILIDHGYNPDTDLFHNEHGLIQLKNKPALEQAIKLYNRSRSEDSIDE